MPSALFFMTAILFVSILSVFMGVVTDLEYISPIIVTPGTPLPPVPPIPGQIPTNCVFAWGPWSECNDNALQIRTPTIIASPEFGGLACPIPQVRPCLQTFTINVIYDSVETSRPFEGVVIDIREGHATTGPSRL